MQYSRIRLWPVLALLAVINCTPAHDSENTGALTQAGLDARYTRHDAQAAVENLRQVPAAEPESLRGHVPARFRIGLGGQTGRGGPLLAEGPHHGGSFECFNSIPTTTAPITN